MEKMIAVKPFNYRQVDLKSGDEFDCDDEHVQLFTLIGFATKPSSVDRNERYFTRVMTAGRGAGGGKRGGGKRVGAGGGKRVA